MEKQNVSQTHTQEQTDPLAYEIESLRAYVKKLAETCKYLSPEIPSEEEKLWTTIYTMTEVEQKLKELVWKKELREQPRPAAERYLRLVWSRD